jgi:hypothetical protein
MNDGGPERVHQSRQTLPVATPCVLFALIHADNGGRLTGTDIIENEPLRSQLARLAQ